MIKVFLLIARTAGILSAANKRSDDSIIRRTRNNGVAKSFPFSIMKNLSP